MTDNHSSWINEAETRIERKERAEASGVPWVLADTWYSWENGPRVEWRGDKGAVISRLSSGEAAWRVAYDTGIHKTFLGKLKRVLPIIHEFPNAELKELVYIEALKSAGYHIAPPPSRAERKAKWEAMRESLENGINASEIPAGHLELSVRAGNAVDALLPNGTIEDFLNADISDFAALHGVGNKTIQELSAMQSTMRERFQHKG